MGMSVYYFDVGQGDCILIDQGTTEILIDAGTGAVNVANLIKPYIDGPLEDIIATHMDADHIGGLAAVLSSYTVLNVWDNGDTSTSATYKTFKAAIQTSGAVEHAGRRGNVITAGTLSFNVLNPVNTSGTSNNNSIVTRLNYGSISFQFEGDAEQEAESSMLAAGLISHVDILKVGHHGSRTASSPAFLKATSPKVAVYQAGIGNSYGHPHPETITALTQIGALIYGTDKYGTIAIKTDGTSYNIDGSRAPPSTTPAAVIPGIPSTSSNTIITTTLTTTTSPTIQGANDIVYITNSGTKYHRAGCRYLSKSAIAISKADAIARGFSPCSVCNP